MWECITFTIWQEICSYSFSLNDSAPTLYHCIRGVGLPVMIVVNVASLPGSTQSSSVGTWMIGGAECENRSISVLAWSKSHYIFLSGKNTICNFLHRLWDVDIFHFILLVTLRLLQRLTHRCWGMNSQLSTTFSSGQQGDTKGNGNLKKQKQKKNYLISSG